MSDLDEFAEQPLDFDSDCYAGAEPLPPGRQCMPMTMFTRDRRKGARI